MLAAPQLLGKLLQESLPAVGISTADWYQNEIGSIASECALKLTVDEVHRIVIELQVLSDSGIQKVLPQVRHWLVTVGWPAQFFRLMRSLENTQIDAQALATIIHKSSILTHSDSDFYVPFLHQDKYFYLVEEKPEGIERVEKTIREELQKNSSDSFSRVSMHRAQHAFMGQGSGARHLRIYILSKPLSEEGQAVLGEAYFKDLSAQILKNQFDAKSIPTAEMEEFVRGLTRPHLTHSRAAEVIGKYWQGWRQAQTQPGVFFFGDNQDQLAVGFPAGFQSEVFGFQKILSRYPGQVSRYYVNRIDSKSGSVNLVTIEFETDTSPEQIARIKSEIKLTAMLPETELIQLYTGANPVFKNMDELYFMEAASVFLSHFLVEENPSLNRILMDLTPEKLQEHEADVSDLKSLLRQSRFQPENIRQVFAKYPAVTRYFVDLFQRSLRLTNAPATNPEKFLNTLDAVGNPEDRVVFTGLFNFICSIQKTNYEQADKNVLAFEVNHLMLQGHGYPKDPEMIRFVYSKHATLYHIQFGKLGRGGIRVLLSKNGDEQREKFQKALQEGYRLAYDQHKKNKDIDESGAKGVVVAKLGVTAEMAFKQAVLGMLDLAMQNQPHALIELGPDENVTKELCDWATETARARGYQYWKTFISGKSDVWGGIGHKDYSVTSTGIYEYKKAWMEQEGLVESGQKELQVGGLTGDLGGGNIKYSQSNIIGVVDYNQKEERPELLYDPAGLNLGTLKQLVQDQKTSFHFPSSRLSPSGVLIADHHRDYSLELDGTTQTKRGGSWLKEMIFELSADVLMLCGGRPNTINRENVQRFLMKNGKPRYRAIFEGANIFIEKVVYRVLESMGILVVPGPSVNKGGVITSSYEVLAGYALDDQTYLREMCVRNGKIPEFRKKYIGTVLDIVRARCRQEYATLRRMMLHQKVTLTQASDLLAADILKKTDYLLEHYDDWITPELERLAVSWYIPDVLEKKVGIKNILKQLPRDEKLKPMVAKVLASQFHYRYGTVVSDSVFREYLHDLSQGIKTLPQPAEILGTPIRNLIAVP